MMHQLVPLSLYKQIVPLFLPFYFLREENLEYARDILLTKLIEVVELEPIRYTFRGLSLKNTL
jgi:hypothetical protein